MAAIHETLRTDFRDPVFAEVYAESFLDSYVATQIKVLREQRELTQEQLAKVLGTTQTAVSRIENINYSAWNIRTLKKLARAFGVRLKVSFETYGSLIDEVRTFERPSLERVEREKDPVIQEELTGATEATSLLADKTDIEPFVLFDQNVLIELAKASKEIFDHYMPKALDIANVAKDVEWYGHIVTDRAEIQPRQKAA